MNFCVKAALLALTSICVSLEGQVKNLNMSELFPLLKTNQKAQAIEQQLMLNGFIPRGLNGRAPKSLEGMVDSISVILTLRKTSKKGNVWGYELLFKNSNVDWLKKRSHIDQLAKTMNVVNGQNHTVLLKTLPQYCLGKESDCFADGVAKYQYFWYWNSPVARTKTIDLSVTKSFEIALSITDNEVESK